MPNKFKTWIDDTNISNTQTSDEFSSDSQRAQGFKAGTKISAIRVNSALRQASLITCALMNVIAPNNTTLNLRSPITDVQNVISTYLSGLGRTITLNGSVNTTPTFYAPTNAGTTGQLLMSNGNNVAPTYVDGVRTTQVRIASTSAGKVVLNQNLNQYFTGQHKISLKCWIDNNSGVNNLQIFNGVALVRSTENKAYFNFQISGGSLLNDSFEYLQMYELRGSADYNDNSQINFTCKKITFHLYTTEAYQVEDVTSKLQIDNIIKYDITGDTI